MRVKHTKKVPSFRYRPQGVELDIGTTVEVDDVLGAILVRRGWGEKVTATPKRKPKADPPEEKEA